MSELTKDESDILRHMLGAVDRVDPANWGFRNHFCAEVDHVPEALLSLENRRLVFRGKTLNDGQDVYFHATDTAKALVGVKAR